MAAPHIATINITVSLSILFHFARSFSSLHFHPWVYQAIRNIHEQVKKYQEGAIDHDYTAYEEVVLILDGVDEVDAEPGDIEDIFYYE